MPFVQIYAQATPSDSVQLATIRLYYSGRAPCTPAGRSGVGLCATPLRCGPAVSSLRSLGSHPSRNPPATPRACRNTGPRAASPSCVPSAHAALRSLVAPCLRSSLTMLCRAPLTPVGQPSLPEPHVPARPSPLLPADRLPYAPAPRCCACAPFRRLPVVATPCRPLPPRLPQLLPSPTIPRPTRRPASLQSASRRYQKPTPRPASLKSASLSPPAQKRQPAAKSGTSGHSIKSHSCLNAVPSGRVSLGRPPNPCDMLRFALHGLGFHPHKARCAHWRAPRRREKHLAIP